MKRQVLIYIHLLEDPENASYTIPLLQWTSEHLPQVDVLDIDNFSDRLLSDYAVKMISKSSKAAVVINNAEKKQPPVGIILGVLQRLERMQQLPSINILTMGTTHTIIRKMSKGLRKLNFRHIDRISEVQKTLQSFFTSS